MGLYKLPKIIGKGNKPSFGARINPHHSLSQGLLCYWLKNEGGGNTIFDATGRNNGSIKSAVSWGSEGLIFQQNASSYVDFGGSTELSALMCPMTIIGSITPSSTTGYGPMISQYQSTANHKLIKLIRFDSGLFYFYYGRNSGYETFTTTLRAYANIRYNYATVVGGSKGAPTCAMYLNDQVQSTNLSSMDDTPDITVAPRLGNDEADTSECFKEEIHYTAVYNRALSSGEVYQFFLNPYQMLHPSVWDAYIVPAAAPPPTGGKSIFGYDSIFHAGGIIQT